MRITTYGAPVLRAASIPTAESSKIMVSRGDAPTLFIAMRKQSGAGFGVDTNIITMITKDAVIELPLQSKEAAANAILDQAIKLNY